MKKKLLFVYPEMMTGGSTTSLINLLNAIDYEKYEVDLQLFRNRGKFFNDIPDSVHVLPEAAEYGYSKTDKIKKFCILLFKGIIFKAFYYGRKYKQKSKTQVYGYGQVLYSKQCYKKYDVAIGFLEFWADSYVLQKVNVTKKIIWVHVDYEKAGMVAQIDRKYYKKADNIVLVSRECVNNFGKLFPENRNKTICIENIFSKKSLEKKAEIFHAELNGKGLSILTVCRLAINHKGLDRMLNVCKRFKEEGLNFTWYIIGNDDSGEFAALYEKYHLKDCVILLGEKDNPYPYYKCADVYLQPSRYEGKPMVVTEALLLGVPVIVTDYASAKEQVTDGFDGIVTENSEEGIYIALKRVIMDKTLLDVFRKNIKNKSYENTYEINKIYDIIK